VSKYGKLPELLEELEHRQYGRLIRNIFNAEWSRLHALGELWLDSMKTTEEIERCGQFRAIVKEGWERGTGSRVTSTSCVWLISAWEALGEEKSVERMARMLIDLEKEPISALALVGEYLT
jgi:hypothetical protein